MKNDLTKCCDLCLHYVPFNEIEGGCYLRSFDFSFYVKEPLDVCSHFVLWDYSEEEETGSEDT